MSILSQLDPSAIGAILLKMTSSLHWPIPGIDESLANIRTSAGELETV
jgi:hypothetical protein